MLRRPPRSTRTDPPFPSPTLFRSKLRLRPDPAAALIREPLIFRRRDGGWLQLEEQPVGEEGFTSLWTDVTRRMNAEAQANRLQERLSDAIEAMADGFALYDAEDRLVVCNQQYRELNAASADALVPGIRWFDFLRIGAYRSEEHTSELQSLMRLSYAVFCLKK